MDVVQQETLIHLLCFISICCIFICNSHSRCNLFQNLEELLYALGLIDENIKNRAKKNQTCSQCRWQPPSLMPVQDTGFLQAVCSSLVMPQVLLSLLTAEVPLSEIAL